MPVIRLATFTMALSIAALVFMGAQRSSHVAAHQDRPIHRSL